MKIELKNIKYSAHLSEETNAFTANLYINGKKVGYVKNAGHGGCTDYYAFDFKYKDLIKEAEKYAALLPDIDYGDFTINSNLENLIDRIFEDWLIKKEISKNSKKGIYYKHPKKGEMLIAWKGWTVNKMLSTPKGVEVIKNTVKKLESEGCKILNNNLKAVL